MAYKIAISPDDRLAVAICEKTRLEHKFKSEAVIWETATGQVIGRFPIEGATLVTFLDPVFRSDSKELAVAVWESAMLGDNILDHRSWTEVQLWDLDNHQITNQFGVPIRGLAYRPGTTELATWSDKGIDFWLSQQFSLPRLSIKNQAAVKWAAFFPSGDRFVALSPKGFDPSDQSISGEVLSFDPTDGRRIGAETYTGLIGPINAVVFTRDGKRFVTATKDRTIRLWDVQTGQENFLLEELASEGTALAFSGDDRFLYCGCADGSIYSWDAGHLSDGVK
jgi:WD40 repeat protein